MGQNHESAQIRENTTEAASLENPGGAAFSLTPPPAQDVLAGAPGAAPAAESLPAKDRRKLGGAPGSGVERRQSVVDQRSGIDRRVVDVGTPTGLERRRGPGRRRTDDRRSAEEGEMTDEQFEFVLAIDTYKRLNNRPFPSWTEVLEVIKQLGYRKVTGSTLNLPGFGKGAGQGDGRGAG